MQEPTFTVGPTPADTLTTADAIDLAAVAGIELLPWQAAEVGKILGLTENGEWAASRYGLAVARQSGKGVILEVVALAKAVLLAERVLWTAHEVRTMQESFMRFRAVLDASAALSGKVASVRAANGQERIMFHNGGEVKFTARSKSATRGLGFRTIIADEAQELDYLTLGAMMPTLSGQRDERTQLILTGTPPYSSKGEVFADARAAAYAGGDDRASWSEWAASREDRSDDPAVWAKTNPSLGVIIMADKISDEWATLQARPDVFRRERLGEWGRSGDKALALDEAQWTAGAVSADRWPDRDPAYTRPRGDLRVLGVDTTFNAEMTTLVEAVPLQGEKVGLRVVDAAPGLDWIAGAVAHMREESPFVIVAFDPIRTGDLTPDLQEVGVRDAGMIRRLVPVTSREFTLACDAIVRANREDRLLHGDPRLDAAALSATRSTFSDGKGWKLVGIDGADVSPLIAAALAVQALREQPRARATSERRARFL